MSQFGGPPQGYGANDPPGILEVDLTFNPMQLFLHATTPQMSINGNPVQAHWGRNHFTVPAGQYRVSTWFPYLLMSRACKGECDAVVYPAYATFLRYSTPTFMFSSGTLIVVGTAPTQMHQMR